MGGFNTAVPMPTTAGYDIRPPVVEDPLDAVTRYRLNQQKLAESQQSLATGQLQQQETQLNLDQRRAINDAYQQAFKPQPDGSYQLDEEGLSKALAQSGHGEAIPGIMRLNTEWKASVAGLQKTKQEIGAAEADAGGRLGAMVKAADYSPALFHTIGLDAMNQGIISREQFAPIDQAIQKALAADPSGAQAKAMLQPVVDQLIAGSPKQQELLNQAKTAKGAEQRGQAASDAQTRLKFENDRKDAAAQLATATNADQYSAALNQLPHGVAKLFPESGEVFDQAGKPTQAGVERIRFVGMTPAEQQAASKAPPERNVTEAELAAITADPKKTREEREAANAALKRLDQSKIAARPVINVPLPPAPGQPTLSGEEYLASLDPATASQVRAISDGRAALPSASARNQAAQQIRQAVFRYDPDFSEQKAQIRRAFTTGTDGRNIGALNTAAVHLDQLAEVSKALGNGSFRPGNALWNATKTMFGGASPTNFEGLKSAVAGEMASALKGNATDQEIHNIAQSIQSKNSPAQLADYIDTQLHVLGAKLNTYQERYQQQIPGDSKWTPVLPSARSVFDKHGFNPTGGAGAATPAAKGVALTPADAQQYLKKTGWTKGPPTADQKAKAAEFARKDGRTF